MRRVITRYVIATLTVQVWVGCVLLHNVSVSTVLSTAIVNRSVSRYGIMCIVYGIPYHSVCIVMHQCTGVSFQHWERIQYSKVIIQLDY